MPDVNLNDLQKLGIAQALYKALGRIVSTKDPDSLRSYCDMGLKELYARTGAKQLEIIVGGLKFGQLTAKTSNPTVKETVFVNDRDLLLNGAEPKDVIDFAKDYAQEFGEWLWKRHKAEGEIPPGCEVVVQEVPAQFVGTTLTGCKPEDLGVALGDALPDAIHGVLEGGSNG